MNRIDNLSVFCMYAAHSGNQETVSVESIDDFREMMRIPEDCLSFGSHAVVITNASEFLKRVKAAALRENYGVHGRLVKYYDPRSFHGGSPEEIEPIFNKRDEYEHQHEYRIAITGVEGNGPLILDIGDISDISILMEHALPADAEAACGVLRRAAAAGGIRWRVCVAGESGGGQKNWASNT